jgi:phage FluMu protein Com
MPNRLSKIFCPECGKLLLEATGEGEKICPKCKKKTHYITTSYGTYEIEVEGTIMKGKLIK